MSPARTVHAVVPASIHAPSRPSGGNAYDRRICQELGAIGWSVRELAIAGAWPRPDAAACAALTRAIAGIGDGGVVLVDGLIASCVPDVLVPEAARLRLVVLVHLPLGIGLTGEGAATDGPHAEGAVASAAAESAVLSAAAESAVLAAAAGVITTSAWTKGWLLTQYDLQPDRVHVAEPGADAAELAVGTASGSELLCVAAVTPNKGHDVLLTALAELSADLRWRCLCVGPLDRDPSFVDRLRGQAVAAGIAERVLFTGPRSGAELAASYAAADLLVVASHFETYGMVVTEALARELPVLGTAVGGLPDALGHADDGGRPGMLVPPGDPAALASALQQWLGDAQLRARLRQAARERRRTLPAWSATSARISAVLAEVAA